MNERCPYVFQLLFQGAVLANLQLNSPSSYLFPIYLEPEQRLLPDLLACLEAWFQIYIYINIYIYRELEDAGVMFLIYFSAGILAFSEPQRLVLHYFCLILVVMNRKEKISPWWFEPGCCTQQLMWKFSPITKNVTGNKSPSPSHRIIREIPDS